MGCTTQVTDGSLQIQQYGLDPCKSFTPFFCHRLDHKELNAEEDDEEQEAEEAAEEGRHQLVDIGVTKTRLSSPFHNMATHIRFSHTIILLFAQVRINYDYWFIDCRVSCRL